MFDGGVYVKEPELGTEAVIGKGLVLVGGLLGKGLVVGIGEWVGADEGSETFETFREMLRADDFGYWATFQGRDEGELTCDGNSWVQGVACAAAQLKSYGARGRGRPGEGGGGARFQVVPGRGDIEWVGAAGAAGAAGLRSWSSEAKDGEGGENDGGEEAHDGGVCFISASSDASPRI
jgi:hypothetical protein